MKYSFFLSLLIPLFWFTNLLICKAQTVSDWNSFITGLNVSPIPHSPSHQVNLTAIITPGYTYQVQYSYLVTGPWSFTGPVWQASNTNSNFVSSFSMGGAPQSVFFRIS